MANILVTIQIIILSLIWIHLREITKLLKEQKQKEEENEFIENFASTDKSVISDHVFKREEEYDKLISDLKKDIYSTEDARPVRGMTYNIPHDEVDKKINEEKYPETEYAE